LFKTASQIYTHNETVMLYFNLKSYFFGSQTTKYEYLGKKKKKRIMHVSGLFSTPEMEGQGLHFSS